MAVDQSKRVLSQDEVEPPFDDLSRQPKTLTTTRRIDNVLYVAGKSQQPQCDIMFVAPAVQEEEAAEFIMSQMGISVKQKAEYLKGPIGTMFKDIGLRVGIDIDRQCYFTSICKWLIPRTARNRPPTKMLRWGMPVLMDEIERVKPKIIVCLGKQAFDMLSDQKMSFDDANGGWFWSDKAKAHLYVMHSPHVLLMKPDLHEMFRVDLQEVKRKYDIISDRDIESIPVNGRVIENSDELREWVAQMQEENRTLFSVDCEWHGATYVDGDLRSIQFAWSDSDAIYIRFRSDSNVYEFDVPYDKVGRILGKHLNNPEVKYIGHHFSADAPWMSHWLGLDILGKCWMDTEFAQQCVDEASELGLERGIAMKYTTLGRYNTELLLWKRENKSLCEDGYGFIPDAILVPYAIRDVIAPFRAAPYIRRQMEAQQLGEYYDTILGPFVTDIFVTFTMTGLPMDVARMDEMRELYTYVRDRLGVKFKQAVAVDASRRLLALFLEKAPNPSDGIERFQSIRSNPGGDHWEDIKRLVGAEHIGVAKPIWEHWLVAPDFNIRSPDQMRRWLFDVAGCTPIKTTSQKAKGLPSMAWEKVLELPAERRKQYTPAVDKQTMQILAEAYPILNDLLNYNAVGNLCKAFLKEADVYVDEETGEEVREEAGLHKWLTSLGKVQGMFSATETGEAPCPCAR